MLRTILRYYYCCVSLYKFHFLFTGTCDAQKAVRNDILYTFSNKHFEMVMFTSFNPLEIDVSFISAFIYFIIINKTILPLLFDSIRIIICIANLQTNVGGNFCDIFGPHTRTHIHTHVKGLNRSPVHFAWKIMCDLTSLSIMNK